MNTGSALMRRQVIAITLLVAGASLLIIGVNLNDRINLVTAQSLELANVAGQSALERGYGKSPPSPVNANAAAYSDPLGNLEIPVAGSPILFIVPNGMSPIDATESPSLSAFASKSFPSRLWKLLSTGDPLFHELVSSGSNTSGEETVTVLISLAPARRETFEMITVNMVVAILATVIAGVMASSFSRLLYAPLSAIASQIEQLEQHHALAPLRRSEREKSSYMEMVADRIQQIGQQIAGDRSELIEARGRLNQILSSLQERVLLVNSEGRIMLASPGVQELLGATGAPETRILEDFVGSDHPLVILVRLALASGESTTHATLPGMHDRRSKPLAVTVQLIVDRGETAGAFISLHDRETVAKLESQLDYSERLADLARITSGIAHEVKNPLNAMVIHLELLREKLERFGPQTIDALPQVEILTTEIQRLERVVQTFLTFNKAPRMQLRPLDVNQVLRETIALAEAEAQAHKATVEQDFNTALPRIAGDADMLKQAFLNIIINGFQAMGQGGLLLVRTSGVNHHIKISITDHGSGIDRGAQDRIFQLYYSTKPAGNGIGLAQAYRAIQLHNGRIGFTSQTGIGTTFDITIPTA